MQVRKRSERRSFVQASHFYDVIGEPSLLDRNERKAYLKFRDAVEQALEPEDFFDFQEVSDIAFRMVEIDRLREANTALIKSPIVLAGLLKFVFGDNVDMARRVALAYFGNDDENAVAADELIEQTGLTPAQIRGHSIVAQLDEQYAISRLISDRATSNERAVKQLQKKQLKRAEKIAAEELAAKAQFDKRLNAVKEVGGESRLASGLERKRRLSLVNDK